VNFRYFIQSSQALAGGLGMLNFNNATSTYPMQMLGRLDGENAVKSGEGFYFEAMDKWTDNEKLHDEFGHISHYIFDQVLKENEKHKKERRHLFSDEETEEQKLAFI
tara:strand:+ start:991 stop:1311 length:321 start_codon:yes stop_codon:yes gene_type:complete